MTLYLGIDLGTSVVKAVIFDEDERPSGEAARPIAVSTPRPGWSEQHPDLWWDALCFCLDRLAAEHPRALGGVAGIGLSGQMLGAVIVDANGRPTRPAILWNDQRSTAECRLLLDRVPDIGRRTNGMPDPGLTAPKLLWLARHEPETLDRARWLLLPKDEVRLRLTGEVATEPSDAGGTMLMDNTTARWDPALCHAAGWEINRLPPVCRSWDVAGGLRGGLARRWGLRPGTPVAAGAGDNMACSLGVGAARAGDAALTIGTSAVLCAVDDVFHPAPDVAVLTAPHAAPDTWLSMGVVLSATQTLDWLLRLLGTDIETLAPQIEAFARSPRLGEAPLMRPSLTGIRTPHNRPDTTAALEGLIPSTDRASLGYAVLEGVAFQILECFEAQRRASVPIGTVSLVGGGARSLLWGTLVASLIDRDIALPEGASLAAPRGAARLAALAASGGDPAGILSQKRRSEHIIRPDPSWAEHLRGRFNRWHAALPVSRSTEQRSPRGSL